MLSLTSKVLVTLFYYQTISRTKSSLLSSVSELSMYLFFTYFFWTWIIRDTLIWLYLVTIAIFVVQYSVEHFSEASNNCSFHIKILCSKYLTNCNKDFMIFGEEVGKQLAINQSKSSKIDLKVIMALMRVFFAMKSA